MLLRWNKFVLLRKTVGLRSRSQGLDINRDGRICGEEIQALLRDKLPPDEVSVVAAGLVCLRIWVVMIWLLMLLCCKYMHPQLMQCLISIQRLSPFLHHTGQSSSARDDDGCSRDERRGDVI